MRTVSSIMAACLLIAACAPKTFAADGNLDYWLDQAEPVETRPAAPESSADEPAPSPLRQRQVSPGALPGVLERSDGKRIPGHIYTTVRRPLQVYDAEHERWRQIPLAAILSIEAVVVDAQMENRWRWKAMGVPERVYTGELYPTRRYQWRVTLADGSQLTGAVKGQPIWIESGGVKSGPFVLHERDKGPIGSTLDELLYVKKIVISRREMLRHFEAGRGNSQR
jgi:hypothetical protein